MIGGVAGGMVNSTKLVCCAHLQPIDLDMCSDHKN